jgi:hypothetical protein
MQAYGFNYFWVGTHFHDLPIGIKFYEIVADSNNTPCIKFNTRDVIVCNKRKRFPRPKRRQVYVPIEIGTLNHYIDNYKGKDPFKTFPPTQELIQLAFKTQSPI